MAFITLKLYPNSKNEMNISYSIMNLHYVYHTYLFKSKPENMYYHTNNEAKPTITQITIYFNLCSCLHIIHSSKTLKAQFNHANIITAKQSQLCTQVENNATQENCDFKFWFYFPQDTTSQNNDYFMYFPFNVYYTRLLFCLQSHDPTIFSQTKYPCTYQNKIHFHFFSLIN